ncbi:MAG: hypothetical protein K0R51_263 [Cytophagaceae bacterium]|jgi:hypothetical protein|nr:hypothetical protein [Cytophagaceae bacterium]
MKKGYQMHLIPFRFSRILVSTIGWILLSMFSRKIKNGRRLFALIEKKQCSCRWAFRVILLEQMML